MVSKILKKVLISALGWGACTVFVVAPGTVIATCGVSGTAVLALTVYSGVLPYTLSKVI